MAKRGRPTKNKYDPIALIEKHLTEFDREYLSRLAFLSVAIWIEAIKGRCSEEDALLRINVAATEIFIDLQKRGFQKPIKRAGRPDSLDANLRHLYVNHIEMNGGTITEAFNNLAKGLDKIPAFFAIRYPISKETSKNFWTERRRKEAEIAAMEFFKSQWLYWYKLLTS